MSHFGVGVEYALHVMTQLARLQLADAPSAKALAEFQGVPAAYLSKIMTRLEKAGLVGAIEGKSGGYRLGRVAEAISFLDVVDAVEGPKKLFECTEVRRRCVLYGGKPPKELTSNICAIHAVMLAAEKNMRAKLAATSLADISGPLNAKIPAEMKVKAVDWFAKQRTVPPRRRKSRSK